MKNLFQPPLLYKGLLSLPIISESELNVSELIICCKPLWTLTKSERSSKVSHTSLSGLLLLLIIISVSPCYCSLSPISLLVLCPRRATAGHLHHLCCCGVKCQACQHKTYRYNCTFRCVLPEGWDGLGMLGIVSPRGTDFESGKLRIMKASANTLDQRMGGSGLIWGWRQIFKEMTFPFVLSFN